MIYNLVSSGEIVARISEDYNINHADYINRVPQWVHQAMGELDINIAFIPTFITIPIVERIGLLPRDIKLITGVEADGCRLTRIHGHGSVKTIELTQRDAIVMTSLGSTVYGDNIVIDTENNKVVMNPTKIRTYNNETIVHTQPSDKYNYILLPNGKIEINSDAKFVTIYYLSYPITFDTIFGFDAPQIPDNEHVKVALTWYVLRNILMRGYLHPIISLTSNDPENNPNRQWTRWKTIARNNASDSDPDQSAILSRLHRSYFYNSMFD